MTQTSTHHTPHASAAKSSPAARGHLHAVLRTVGKCAAILLLCAVLLATLVLSVSLAMVHATAPSITAHNADLSGVTAALRAGEYDLILVLGAGLKNNAQDPSHMLEDRLIVATDLYKSAADAHVPLLMSGDRSGSHYDEVTVMQRVALESGVPEADILLDPQGYSTYESLSHVRDDFGAKKILIVTQGYHLHRALHIARELGIDADGVSADLRDYHLQIRYELREMLARVKDLYVAAMPTA